MTLFRSDPPRLSTATLQDSVDSWGDDNSSTADRQTTEERGTQITPGGEMNKDIPCIYYLLLKEERKK